MRQPGASLVISAAAGLDYAWFVGFGVSLAVYLGLMSARSAKGAKVLKELKVLVRSADGAGC